MKLEVPDFVSEVGMEWFEAGLVYHGQIQKLAKGGRGNSSK